LKESYLTISSYLLVGMPNFGRTEAIVMAAAADDALIQALRESCGRLCSNESFI